MSNSIFHSFSRALFNLAQQNQSRFTLDQGHYGLFMPFTDHGVNFPVTQPLTSFNLSWALLNTNTLRELSPAIVAAVAFTTFLLAAQMPVKIAIVSLILIDMLVNPFMTDVDIFFVFQTPRNLFRTQILSDQLLNPIPGFGSYAGLSLIPSTERKSVRLFGSVSTSALIAT